MEPSIRIQSFTGDTIKDYITDLASLRIQVFREYPYLYEGYLEYEQEYLQTYINAPNAIVVIAFDGKQVIGSSVENFSLNNMDGESIPFHDFLGKYVLLDFWASWCGPCIQQMPYAKELKKRMADQSDLVFLYVSVDSDETAWRHGVKQHEIEGINLHAGTAGNILKKIIRHPRSGGRGCLITIFG